MDNFYSSPELYDSLADNKLGACGTVRLSRRGIPDEMKAASVQSRKGDLPAFFRKGRLLGVSWHDTKRVSVLSTIHNNSTVQKEIRHRGSENGRRSIIKPKVAEQYNQHMGGVDLLDQRMPSLILATVQLLHMHQVYTLLVSSVIPGNQMSPMVTVLHLRM